MHLTPIRNPALHTIQDIRIIEASESSMPSIPCLMQRAGLAASQLSNRLLTQKKAPVLVIAGPGNNGGDAFETAANLADTGHSVYVLVCGDPNLYSGDAQLAYTRVSATNTQLIWYSGCQSIPDKTWGLIIDGLFGIGLTRTISPHLQELITYINAYSAQHSIPVLSLDIPSGLNADTGNFVQDTPTAVTATHTLSLISDKPGLHTANGKDFSGKILVDDLGIASQRFPESHCHLNLPSYFQQCLPPRKHNSHKGSFGDVCIIGGASGMTGAAILAARTALFSGAGKVLIGFIDQAPDYDPCHPEIMCHHVKDIILNHKQTIVIGPGLGSSESARSTLKSVLQSTNQLVIDADALNLIASEKHLQQLLLTRSSISILTPHPLEAARLLQIQVKDVQNDRLRAARQLSAKTNAVVILKGSGSIICTPEGEARINTSGNPGLASGGTGDVLAGLCGALRAQGMNSFDSACFAAWLHGSAADEMATSGTGPVGLTASELASQIRRLLNASAIETVRFNQPDH